MPEPGAIITGPVSITIDIPDAEYPDPIFLVSTPMLKDVPFTLDEIKEISAIGFCADTPATQLIQDIRFHHQHPMRTELAQATLKDARTEEKANWNEEPAPYPPQMVLKDARYKVEGTPILQWRSVYDISQADTYDIPDGWELSLSGSPIILGFAAWDNAESIFSLITQMQAPDALQVIAGMMDTEQSSLLASTFAARELKGNRAVRKVTTTAVRNIIRDNHLASQENMAENHRGRTRALNIATSLGAVPVAIGVLPPYYTSSHQQFARDSRRITARGLSWAARQTLEQETYGTQWEAWEEALLSCLPEGWQRVELPHYSYEAGHSGQPVLWVTPLPSDLWRDVELAARKAARQCKMSGGRAF
jgi:hypothetical protein